MGEATTADPRGHTYGVKLVRGPFVRLDPMQRRAGMSRRFCPMRPLCGPKVRTWQRTCSVAPAA